MEQHRHKVINKINRIITVKEELYCYEKNLIELLEGGGEGEEKFRDFDNDNIAKLYKIRCEINELLRST